MRIVSFIFLSFVGVEYILLGLSGLTGYGLFIAPLFAYFMVVVPFAFVDSFVRCAASWSGSCPTDVAFHITNSYQVVHITSAIALILGFLSIFGVIAMLRKKKIGYLIWGGLVILALFTATYNVLSYLLYPQLFLSRGVALKEVDLLSVAIPIVSFIWTVLYGLAFLKVKRSTQSDLLLR